jgi:O-antigen/teichoic acid export membrane protein
MLKSFVENKRFLILLDQAIFSGTSFLMTIFLARKLESQLFGMYSGLILGVFLFISLSSSLVIQPFQVNLANLENKSSYVSFTFQVQLLILSLTVLSLYSLLSFVTIKGFNEVALLYLFFYVMHDYVRKILLALDKAKEVVVMDFISCLGQIIVVAILFLTDKEISLHILYYYLSLAYLPAFLLGFVILKPKLILFSKFKEYTKIHLVQGKWLFFTALIQWWSGNLFVVASGYYLGSVALGALRLSQSLFGVLNVLLQTFENYVLPQTAIRFTESKEAAIHYLMKMTKYAGLIFFVFMAVVFVFSEPIIRIAGGDKFVEYAFLLKGMTILYLLIYISQPIRIGIRIMVLNDYFFYGYLLSLAFSVLCSDYFLTHYGLIGALSGLIGSQLIVILFWQVVLSKKQFYLWKSFISF